MDPTQKTWLEKLTKKAADHEVDEAKREFKEAMVAKLYGDILAENNEIRKKLNSMVATDKQGKNEQGLLDEGTLDQTKVLDLDDEATLLSDEDQAKMDELQRQWVLKMNQLEMGPDGKKPKIKVKKKNDLGGEDEVEVEVDFSEEELINELYEPMRRQGLVPETFIPDKYSLVKKRLDGTFNDYAQRLEKEEKKGFFKENQSLLFASLGFGLTVTGGIATINQASQDISKNAKEIGEVFKDPKKLGEGILEGVKKPFVDANKDNSTMLTGMKDAFSGLKGLGEKMPFKDFGKDQAVAMDLLTTATDFIGKGVDGTLDRMEVNKENRGEKDRLKEPPPRKAQAGRMSMAIVGSLAHGLGTAFADSGLGMVASSAFGSYVNTNAIAKALASDPITSGNVEQARDLLAAGFSKVLKACDPGTDGSTALLDKAGLKMESTFKAGVDVAAVLKELEVEDTSFNPAAVMIPFINAGTAAANASKSVKVTVPPPQGSNQPATDLTVDELFTRDLKKIREKANDKVSEEFKRQETEEEQESKADLNELEDAYKNKDAEKFRGLLDKKIAKLKHDARILKWGSTVGGMAFDVASKALAPLAIGGSILKIAMSLREALKRGEDMRKFIDNHRDMVNAASSYGGAVANFVSNAAMQKQHYVLQTGFEALKMIGAIVECGAVTAPIGKAVQAGASMLAATETLLYEINKRMKLETAWRQYKDALLHPENRKKRLIAIRNNPTLAKYAAAWGALIEKDPLVQDFVANCGLDEKSLQDEGADTHKVVEYFEARFADDISVVGRKITVPSASWAPSPIEFTMECWVSTVKLGMEKAELDMPAINRTVEVSLLQFQSALDEIKDLKKQNTPIPVDKKTAADKLADKIKNELMSYVPRKVAAKGGKKEMHDSMESVRRAFVKCAEEAKKELADLTA